MRATEFVTASLGALAIGTMFVFAFDTAAKLPDVHFSYSTDECVKVVNYTDTEYSCENLPDRFYHVWAE